MLGALILLILIVSVIVLTVKVRGQKRRLEKLEYNQPKYKRYNFIDIDNQIPSQLGVEELNSPLVYLVDHQGYVRLKLEGRISDIQPGQIKNAIGVIAKIAKWGFLA